MSVAKNKRILRDVHGYHNIVDCLVQEAFENRKRFGQLSDKVMDTSNRLRYLAFLYKKAEKS